MQYAVVVGYKAKANVYLFHFIFRFNYLNKSVKMTTDIIENEELDKDTVGADELNSLFSKKYNLLTETAVTLKATYINKLSLTK